MQKIAYFGVLILLLYSFSSCTRGKEKMLLPDLVHAEAVMYEHPDSALHLLETMQMPAPSDRLQHATWCLLITQARDKNYIKHTSDSLINIAYSYFMEQNDPQRKAMVLNYEGTIHLKAFANTEKATQFYLEASKEVEQTKDYQLGFLIYMNLGNIYAYRNMPGYAMPAFQKAHEYAKQSKNKSYISSSLRFIARAYSLQENWAKAIEYYTQAYELVKTTDKRRTISATASELSNIYNHTKDYTLAMKYVQESLKIDREEHLKDEATLLTIGDIYRNIGNIDSACYYLNEAALSDNIYTCRNANQALWYLNRDLTKDYEKALEYSGNFWIYTDSIQKIDKSKELIKMQEQFNQQKIVNEKNQLQIEKDHITRNALSGLILLLCLIATIICIYQRKLIRKERTIQKNKEQMHSYTIKIHENESLINRNENRIKELSAQMEANQEIQELWEEQQTALTDIQQQNKTLKQENISLQGNIDQYSISQQEKESNIQALKTASDEIQQLHDREQYLCNLLIKKIEVLNTFKDSRGSLDVIQLEMVREAVDEIYNHYTQRLSRQFSSLTESDLQFCCLIKLKFNISKIAQLLGISPTSVSKKKLRLKARIADNPNSPLGENQNLDLWLWEY